jgi:hypothetical protein
MERRKALIVASTGAAVLASVAGAMAINLGILGATSQE